MLKFSSIQDTIIDARRRVAMRDNSLGPGTIPRAITDPFPKLEHTFIIAALLDTQGCCRECVALAHVEAARRDFDPATGIRRFVDGLVVRHGYRCRQCNVAPVSPPLQR